MPNSKHFCGSKITWLLIIVICLTLLAPSAFAAPEITIFGNLIDIVDGDTTPSTADGTDFGSEAEQHFSVYNEGDATLTITNVTITGANASDFSVVFYNPDLPAGYVGSLIIGFNPTATGIRTATVNIANNDPNENPFNFAIRGTVPVKPVINNLTLTGNCLGSTTYLYVQAFGANLTYQWQRREPGSTNFVNLSGAINNYYSSEPVTLADDQAGYRVIVTSGATNTISNELLLAPIAVTNPSATYDFSSGATNVTLFGNATNSTGEGVVLTASQGGQAGALLLPELSSEALVRGFTATFKLRVENGNGFGDGFSFNWGTDLSEALPEEAYATAENGFGNGLRVCFDWFNNGGGEGPSVKVKWGTNTIASYYNNLLLPAYDNSFAETSIRLNPDGTLDVNYNCTPVFSRLPIPGYTPLYHARFAMGARTGDVYSRHTVDDLALQLVTSSSILDATLPGSPIIATSTNSAPTTTAPKAIDNNVTSKYLNFDKLNTGIMMTPIGPQPVRALTFISAEDVPDRDPSSFVLEGSNDGTNFTRIASNAVPVFPARNFIQSFPLPETSLFGQYRLLFPTLSNSVAANSMQIAEVELLHYEELTSTNDTVSITLPPGAVDVRGVGMLFDRQLGLLRKFEIAPIAGGDTVVNIIPAAGAKVLKGFELIGAADDFTYPHRRPSSVTVAGSNDGINYTNLATVTPAAPSFNSQIQEFATPTNTTAYARYRITFGPPFSGDRIQVGEMRLFGEAAAPLPPPALSIRASGSNVQISWTNAPGFTLESTSSLTPVNWGSVGIVPVLNNEINTVTVSATNSASFFRLRK